MAASASSGCLDQGQSFDFDSFIDSISNTVDPTTAIDPVTINNVDIFASEGGINDCVYASEQNMTFDKGIEVYNPNNPTESLGRVPVEVNGIDTTYAETVKNAAADYVQKAKDIQSVFAVKTSAVSSVTSANVIKP